MISTDQLTNATTVSIFFITGPGVACNNRNLQLSIGANHTWGKENSFGFGYNAKLMGLEPECTLYHAMSFDHTQVGASAALIPILSNPEQEFQQACTDAQSHFDAAFSPTDAGYQFSGNLPSLEVTSSGKGKDKKIVDLFHWSLSALVALERTDFKSFRRQFVISDGPAIRTSGFSTEGSAGAYLWDLSYSSYSYTLLDPEYTRQLVSHIIANTDFTSAPIGLPASWDAYSYDKPDSAGTYVFDYIAIFLLLQQYVTGSGDFEFLSQPIANQHDPTISRTPFQLMEAVAWAWKNYPASTQSFYLRDYGGNKRSFLESDATYHSSVASLQGANAGMLFSTANLLEVMMEKNKNKKQKQKDKNNQQQKIADMRSNATRIVEDLIKYQYESVPSSSGGGSGIWKCLSQYAYEKPWTVKCICDSMYIPLSQYLAADNSHSSNSSSSSSSKIKNNNNNLFKIPSAVRKGMVKFFMSVLLSHEAGWVKSFSNSDPSQKNINCTPSQCTNAMKVAMRADWSSVGSYLGNAGTAVDAIAQLEHGGDDDGDGDSDAQTKEEAPFTQTLTLLRALTKVANYTQPSQALATFTPPFMKSYLRDNYGIAEPDVAYDPSFPEFFDNNSAYGGAFSRTTRSIQNSGASIADAIVRSIFGWRPGWKNYLVDRSDHAAVSQAIADSLWMPKIPRGDFSGVLRNIRTPFAGALIDITADKSGLTWKYSKIEKTP